MRAVRFIDAINQGLRSSMNEDDSVVVLGEDVTLGGPFGATQDLESLFEGRVFNTPISEGAVVGMAVGAAATGMRPVVEIMFIDFITLAMDQLVNHAAKLHYMSGGQLQVPLTIRAQGGVSGSYGAHHSQSLEAWFMHVPGLNVVAPSTPSDAYWLLRQAIADDNPVLFLEHRALYWSKGIVSDDYELGLGQAAVARSGSDVTIVSYSRAMGAALEAAESLATEGVEVEVVDLRSLAPLDMETVLASVEKTRHLVIAHEAVKTGGPGAEVAARVSDALFGVLEGPIRRVGSPAAPVPNSPALEEAFVPSAEDIAAAVLSTTQQQLNEKRSLDAS